jgi:hypothetical protein
MLDDVYTYVQVLDQRARGCQRTRHGGEVFSRMDWQHERLQIRPCILASELP